MFPKDLGLCEGIYTGVEVRRSLNNYKISEANVRMKPVVLLCVVLLLVAAMSTDDML